MSDLISREALLDDIDEKYCDDCVKCSGSCRYGEIREIVLSQPTIEEISVVRCKDCESYIPRKRSCRSEYLNGCTIPNGYCFNGVRKKVDND